MISKVGKRIIKYIFILSGLIFLVLSCKIAFVGGRKGENMRPPKLYRELLENQFEYENLSLKFSADLFIGEEKQEFSGIIRMKKDTAIWISLRSYNIEGARMLITKDSVKFSNREEVTDNGNRHLYEIKWEVAGITKESNQALRANKFSRRLISITDTNGSRMLIPFMKLTSPSAIGDNVAKFTGHTVIFTANLPYPAPLDMSLGVKIPVIL